MAAPLSRRRALLLLGAAAAGLAACTGEQEPPARSGPPTTTPPPRQTRTSAPAPVVVPDVPALQRALERAREVLARTESIIGARGAWAVLLEEAVAAHAEQVSVLERVLTAGGVAIPKTEPATPTPGPPDDTSVTSAPRDDTTATSAPPDPKATEARVARQIRDLARFLHQDGSAEALAALASVSAVNVPMLASVSGERTALTALLGVPVRWPVTSGLTGDVAATLLEAYRPAVYGFEVLAARSGGPERAAYLQTLEWLRQTADPLSAAAGDAAPPPPLGYGLPGPVADEAQRRALATSLFRSLPASVVSVVPELTGDTEGLTGCVQLLATTLERGRPWGLRLSGFPGMRVP